MKESKTQDAFSENSWSKERFSMWFYELFQNIYSWFSFEKQPLPDDEAGELIRRTLAQKSWLDTLTSAWVEQPWWVKCSIIAGATLSSGVIFNIPVLFMCLIGVLSVSMHSLFVAHEHQRFSRAQLMASETIALNKDLKASQQMLDEANVAVEHAAAELTKHSEKMKSDAHLIEEGVAQLKKHQEQLTGQAAAVASATAGLGAATARVQSSQQSYAIMVEQFGHLVHEQQLAVEPQHISNDFASFWATLSVELDANAELIAEMSQPSNAFQGS